MKIEKMRLKTERIHQIAVKVSASAGSAEQEQAKPGSAAYSAINSAAE